MIAHLKRLGGANVHDRGIVYVMRTGACHGQAVEVHDPDLDDSDCKDSWTTWGSLQWTLDINNRITRRPFFEGWCACHTEASLLAAPTHEEKHRSEARKGAAEGLPYRRELKISSDKEDWPDPLGISGKRISNFWEKRSEMSLCTWCFKRNNAIERTLNRRHPKWSSCHAKESCLKCLWTDWLLWVVLSET